MIQLFQEIVLLLKRVNSRYSVLVDYDWACLWFNKRLTLSQII